MEEPPIDYRRDARWLAGLRITRAVENRFGSRWSRRQQRLVERLVAACDAGQLHERDVDAVLAGRLRLPG